MVSKIWMRIFPDYLGAWQIKDREFFENIFLLLSLQKIVQLYLLKMNNYDMFFKNRYTFILLLFIQQLGPEISRTNLIFVS